MRAPGFSLKDRTGVIYDLANLSGSRTVLLFLWELDTSTKLWIRELNRRARTAPGAPKVAVIILRPDRVAIREFVTSENPVVIPILFATPTIGRLYGITPATSALFVLEHGIVMRRQLGDVVVSSVLPAPTVFR
jgi:hypothetical protein